jgi:2Fe-2S ferredoxin
MPLVTFIEADGHRHEVDAEIGSSLKQVALDHLVPGILGDCGGTATCGTCHAYVATEYASRLEPPSEEEKLTLSGVLAPVTGDSRLTCQITMSQGLDGIVLTLPDVQ